MDEWMKLLACLPEEPDFQWRWEEILKTPLAPLFERMQKTPQEKQWHGEGDVWTHTRMVCEALCGLEGFRALPVRRRRELALAALLHDMGKIFRTRLEDGLLVSPGHGAAGAQEVRQILWKEFGLSGESEKQNMRETICLLIRYHTLPLHLLDQKDPHRRARKVAANGELAPDFTLNMLCLLAEADILGRVCMDKEEKLDEIQMSIELAKEAECLHGAYQFPSDTTGHAYLSGGNVWPGQTLYDDSWGEVILMCGLPGTGKDTWIQKHWPDLPVVSLDDIRRRMGIDPTDNQGEVVQTAKEQAREYLRAKRPFIWNATSITPLLRGKQCTLFEEYHASVRIVYLETTWQENLRRNAGRKYKVPENVIERMMSGLILPERHEARRVEWICI